MSNKSAKYLHSCEAEDTSDYCAKEAMGACRCLGLRQVQREKGTYSSMKGGWGETAEGILTK